MMRSVTHSNDATTHNVVHLDVAHPAGSSLDLAARVARLEAILIPPDDRGVPLKVAAERLGVHRNTVQRWIAEGRVPAVRWRNRWEVDPTWLASQAVHQLLAESR